MFSLVKMIVASTLAAMAGASAVAAMDSAPLRIARFEVQGFAPSTPKPGTGAVAKAADGHFWANADVNGQAVRFLVDTGATAVALTPADAEKLGFKPADLKYGYNVTTATGSTRAAAVTLTSVSIDGARLEDVKALVVAEGLDVSLLGMSYLGRLTRFEATRDTLRLQP
ncbi:MAG: TIGR02281 family clan AA aspartic protease [Alphaproteobacteria bacterium]